MTLDIGDRIKLEKEKDSRLHSLEQQVNQLSNAYSTFADMVIQSKLLMRFVRKSSSMFHLKTLILYLEQSGYY
jgi:hypothetical protein